MSPRPETLTNAERRKFSLAKSISKTGSSVDDDKPRSHSGRASHDSKSSKATDDEPADGPGEIVFITS
ncbi:hypothetical protein RRG08_038541 [Elysia crispata]|uniref:Uncharacterized protein n=1 Tax=Elysia crispata TaxID=231223 RepID=A0AAE1E8K8_9GAST|nr:hypothetical protein RRG08_038541 [Elysia crispata]